MEEDLTDFASFCASRRKQSPTSIPNLAASQEIITPKVPNEYGGIYDRPKQPKITLARALMMNDSFWNLMFALGMTIGMTVVFLIVGENPSQKPFPYSASLMFWLTLIGMPLLIKKLNGVSFNDDKFFNKQGVEINIEKQFPNSFFTITTTIAVVALTGLIFDSHFKEVSKLIFFAIAFIFLFFIPALFFNAYNCPISILFNASFWKEVNNQTDHSTYVRRKSLAPDYVTNPIYRNMPINLFHKRR